jgi:hypothetical protein
VPLGRSLGFEQVESSLDYLAQVYRAVRKWEDNDCPYLPVLLALVLEMRRIALLTSGSGSRAVDYQHESSIASLFDSQYSSHVGGQAMKWPQKPFGRGYL